MNTDQGGGFVQRVLISNLGRFYRNHVETLVAQRKELRSITSKQKALLEEFLHEREKIPAKQLRNVKNRSTIYLHEKVKSVVEELLKLPVINE